MVKWLSVFIFVVIAFSLILLGLGFLLHTNEERVTTFKENIAQRENKKELAQLNSLFVESKIDSTNTTTVFPTINKNIMVKNLTCVSDEQCVVVSAKFRDLTCQIAINKIGASLLKKVKKDQTTVGQCPPFQVNSKAACQSNLCTLVDNNYVQ